MCYSGPFWEGRQRNPSILDDPVKNYPKVTPEDHPEVELKNEKEDAFETIKR